MGPFRVSAHGAQQYRLDIPGLRRVFPRITSSACAPTSDVPDRLGGDADRLGGDAGELAGIFLSIDRIFPTAT